MHTPIAKWLQLNGQFRVTWEFVLDVTVINRPKKMLQNLCFDLATMGDLKLEERPQNYTLGPE